MSKPTPKATDLKAYTDRKVPLIINYGMGVDSTAMLVGFWLLGIVPDLIIFADVGDEKPETYDYLPIINAWLERIGFPTVTVVRYKPARAAYHTLSGLCQINETLPSLAFGGHSCSLRFKAEVIDRFLCGVSRGVNKCEAWLPEASRPVKGKVANAAKAIKCIGYDAGGADSKRSFRATTDDGVFRYRFPLQEWAGLARSASARSLRPVSRCRSRARASSAPRRRSGK